MTVEQKFYPVRAAIQVDEARLQKMNDRVLGRLLNMRTWRLTTDGVSVGVFNRNRREFERHSIPGPPAV